jgi:hypothetical protein
LITLNSGKIPENQAPGNFTVEILLTDSKNSQKKEKVKFEVIKTMLPNSVEKKVVEEKKIKEVKKVEVQIEPLELIAYIKGTTDRGEVIV